MNRILFIVTSIACALSSAQTVQSKIETKELSVSTSSVLIKYTQGSGFSPRPSVHNVTIDSNGQVVSESKLLSNTTASKIVLAKLSAVALKNLKQQIASVPENTQTVDQYPDSPKCMDAPSTNISITSKNVNITIYSWASCHTYKSCDGSATELSELMLGLANLAK